MPAESSDSLDPGALASNLKSASADLPWSGRMLMLSLNFLPFLHALAVAGTLCLLHASFPARLGAALAVLYLAPPLLARLLLVLNPFAPGRIHPGTRAFFAWWTLFQLQIVFCRLPALEEMLRLVPGLYSLWLRLWGSRIGRFTYWSPGTLVTDRSFLIIGDDVVFGAGVRLNAHVLARNKGHRMELLLAPVRIGDRAIIGGYSLLTAGSEICPDETPHAFLILPPGSRWNHGKRIRSQEWAEFE